VNLSNKIERHESQFAVKFRQGLVDQLESEGWTAKFIFGDFPSLGRVQSAVTLDGIRDFMAEACGHHHRLIVEICNDNRQAILGNLMKLEFSARRFEEAKISRRALPILIALDEDTKKRLRKQGGIDGSIAPFQEYVANANGPWKGLITTNLYGIVIR
jgi:hypothetical protein